MLRSIHQVLIVFTLTTACSTAVVSRAPIPASATATSGHVSEEWFFSEALGVRKHALGYLPASYARDATRRYPVAYYLHGLSGAEADWMAKGSIDVAADSLFAAGTPEMIVVLPDGDDGWYTTWVHQFSYRTCADTLHTES